VENFLLTVFFMQLIKRLEASCGEFFVDSLFYADK
jgi:hypothetical protein